MVSGRGERVMCFMEGQGVDVSLFSLLFSLFLFSSLSLVLSCLVLSCLVLSCLVLSCLVLSCLVLSCLVLSCLVLSCLVLSCLVLSCLVLSCLCWCARVLVCVLAGSTLSTVSLRRAGVQQLYQVQRMIGGIGNMLFSTCSQNLNV